LIEALDNKRGKISEAARIIAQKYGLSKNKVYDEALKLKAKRTL